MKLSVIYAHPDKNSFNHAIADVVLDELVHHGCEIFYHDLYEEKFDPILLTEEFPRDVSLPPDVERHCREIASVDGIIIIHPNWWGQPPAILKGWVDRVIRPGIAYEFLEEDQGEGVPNGLLNAKAALVFNTSNTESKRELDVFGDPLETIWKNCIFGLCGLNEFKRKMFNIVVTSSDTQRARWLQDVREMVRDFLESIDH